ncbi:transposase [Streptomyces sp. MN13]
MACVLTTGQAGDAPAFTAVMARCAFLGDEAVRAPDRTWSWRRAYSSRAIRDHLRKRGIRTVIPVPADQRGHRLRRGSRGGRPPAFDREIYKQRNTVERCINRLKQWRGIAKPARGKQATLTRMTSTSCSARTQRAASCGPGSRSPRKAGRPARRAIRHQPHPRASRWTQDDDPVRAVPDRRRGGSAPGSLDPLVL